MSERVEIRPNPPVKPDGKLYCLLLGRAANSVKNLDVTISAYAEGLPDEMEGSHGNPFRGRFITFVGDFWASYKQVVVVVEGPEAEEAASRVRDHLHHEPPNFSSFYSAPYPHQQPPPLQQSINRNKRFYDEWIRLRGEVLERKKMRGE